MVGTTDWKARAEREAAAILAETDAGPHESYERLVALLAVAWLQGVNYGSHDTLAQVEASFTRMAAEL